MDIDGGCHCGAITYAAKIDLEKVGICHCTDCQTLSATAFRTVVHVPRVAFKFLTGTPKTYVKTAESGNKRAQVFCGDCGTHLYAGPAEESDTDTISVRVGSANQRDAMPPKAHNWFRSAQGWLKDMDALPKNERQR